MRLSAFVLLAVLAIALVGAFALPNPIERELSAGGLKVKVLGQSGKIRLAAAGGKNKGDDNSDSGANVVIQMDSLWELDANGRRASRDNDNNGNKHAFNNFASQTFTFSPITTTTYMGAACQQVVFNATGIQTGSSWLAVQLMVFTESKTFTVGQDSVTVAPGQMKFNVQVAYWPFCGSSGGPTCTLNGNTFTGNSLQFNIKMFTKSKGGAKNTTASDPTKRNPVFPFPDGNSIGFVSQAQVDSWSNWVNLPTPPALGVRDQGDDASVNVFNINLPKFNTWVLYDPTVVVNGLTDSPASHTAASIGSLAVAMIVTFLMTA